MLHRNAGGFVDGVNLEILDGFQGFAVGTTVGRVETRQADEGALKLVELSEKYPVWHRVLTRIPLFGKVDSSVYLVYSVRESITPI